MERLLSVTPPASARSSVKKKKMLVSLLSVGAVCALAVAGCAADDHVELRRPVPADPAEPAVSAGIKPLANAEPGPGRASRCVMECCRCDADSNGDPILSTCDCVCCEWAPYLCC